jgi:SNF2 family DNA or RNA helicase
MTPGPLDLTFSRLLPVHRACNVERSGNFERRERPTERFAPVRRRHRRVPDFDAMVGPWEFQREGVCALIDNPLFLLAYEMRLGKTAVSLQALDGAGFVVCPSVARLVWRDECALWRPDLTPRIVTADQAPEDFVPKENELVITNFEALPTPVDRYSLIRASMHGVQPIIDEAHAVKNKKAQRTKAVRALIRQCKKGWLLTGTPLDGTPLDLYGVLESGLLARKAFGGFGNFVDLFGGKWKRRGGYTFTPTRFDEIQVALSRVMLVRKRADVFKGLPRKQYVDIPIEIGKLDELEKAEAEWTLFGATKLPPFEMLAKAMAQLADAKVASMLEIVQEHEDDGHRLLVFSRFRSPINALANRVGWGVIHGDVPDDERHKLVKKFQDGKLKGLALTIQTGSMALKLSAATHELFVAPDYRAILNKQAEDRGESLDRKEGLVIERMIADHPLDRRLFQILTQKETLESAVIR